MASFKRAEFWHRTGSAADRVTFYATSCFVSTNLAKEAGKLTNWKGKFWASPATDPYSGGPKLLIYKLFQKG